MEMLLKIGAVENVEAYVHNELEAGRLIFGLGHAGTLSVGRNHGAAVIEAISDRRPAVVGPCLDAVQLVAAAGAVFVGVDAARAGFDGQSLRVAMPDRVDLRQRVR